MEQNLRQITPKYRRQKRWDSLGRAWKWMSGSPDADDLNMINSGLTRITDNTNKQIQINNEIYDGLNNATDTINYLITVEDKTHELIKSSNGLLKIILNLDIVNQEIIKILNSITFSKLGLVSNRMLRQKETRLIDQILYDQGTPTDLLDEILGFTTVTIGTDGETILYIINIPNLSNTTYQHLKIIPVISNALRIKLDGNEYLHGNGELYLKTDVCSKLGNWSLCNLNNLKDVSTDECLSNIITGQDSKCIYETIEHYPTITEMSSTILLLNEVNDTLFNTCGVSDRKLVGSFLITYTNCSVSIRNISFTNQIINAVDHPIFTPSTGLNVTKRHIEQPTDIHLLRKLHHKNLDHLENLKHTTTTHHWTIIGGFSFTSSMIIIFAIYTLLRLRTRTAEVHINPTNPAHTVEGQSAVPATYYKPPSLTA